MNKIRRFCLGLLLLTGSVPGFASLTVISDNGGVDATSCLSVIASPAEASIENIPVASLLAPMPSQGLNRDPRFPVVSDLTPGHVASASINIPGLIQPIFVIGNDLYSIRWVKQHVDQLMKLHAIGIITNVNASEFHTLQTAWHLPLAPASLDGISRLLPVEHYPFLIYQGWIIQ